jgi:hypothetical protein
VSFLFCTPDGRLKPTFPEGEPIIVAYLCIPSREVDPSKCRKVNDSSLNVRYFVPCFLTMRHTNTEKTMDLSPSYIQKALDQIAGPMKNASKLQDGSLLIEISGCTCIKLTWLPNLSPRNGNTEDPRGRASLILRG